MVPRGGKPQRSLASVTPCEEMALVDVSLSSQSLVGRSRQEKQAITRGKAFYADKAIQDSEATYPLKNSAILDSGTTIHIFNNPNHIYNLRPALPRDFI